MQNMFYIPIRPTLKLSKSIIWPHRVLQFQSHSPVADVEPRLGVPAWHHERISYPMTKVVGDRVNIFMLVNLVPYMLKDLQKWMSSNALCSFFLVHVGKLHLTSYASKSAIPTDTRTNLSLSHPDIAS